jgi:hypothetical protein
MAATSTGAALTQAHRAQQLAVQAGSLRGLLVLWRAVDVTRLSDTIEVFAHAAALLAGEGFDASALVAAQYMTLFRQAEIGSGVAVAQAARLDRDYLAGQVRGAALKGIIDGRRAGMSVSTAKSNGLVRVVGTFGKLVLAGGRMTIVGAVQSDRRALGWQRATSGDPCAFCRMLAGRGVTYKTEKSADFEPHDNCGCTPEPLYLGEGVDPRAAEYRREWTKSQKWAASNVTRSQGTSNNALNNYRQWLAAGKPEPGRNGGNTGQPTGETR